jgi:hypothetical protein
VVEVVEQAAAQGLGDQQVDLAVDPGQAQPFGVGAGVAST